MQKRMVQLCETALVAMETRTLKPGETYSISPGPGGGTGGSTTMAMYPGSRTWGGEGRFGGVLGFQGSQRPVEPHLHGVARSWASAPELYQRAALAVSSHFRILPRPLPAQQRLPSPPPHQLYAAFESKPGTSAWLGLIR